jgi:ABC-type dipeptide/oligopeptide/nickel transport system permease subunit
MTAHAYIRTSRRAWTSAPVPARVGAVIAIVCIAVGLLGPYVSPHDPAEIVGSPYATPTHAFPLGLDFLGRDVLSRFLWGGRTCLVIALLGTLLAYVIGISVGIGCAYVRGWPDELLMRVTDVALAFPSLILVLLFVVAVGNDLAFVAIAIAIAHAPRIARIVRSAALEVVDLPYVEAARARGESAFYVIARELLPNIRSPILVDVGLRFTYSVLLVASLGFLGLGLQPPAADWGLMLGENRTGIIIQPWPMIAPVVILGLLTIGINLWIDGYGRRRGVATWIEEERTVRGS